MTDAATVDPYGLLAEPATLKIQRLLPGPVERGHRDPLRARDQRHP